MIYLPQWERQLQPPFNKTSLAPAIKEARSALTQGAASRTHVEGIREQQIYRGVGPSPGRSGAGPAVNWRTYDYMNGASGAITPAPGAIAHSYKTNDQCFMYLYVSIKFPLCNKQKKIISIGTHLCSTVYVIYFTLLN